MKMQKRFMGLALTAGLLLAAGQASATIINDNYVGAYSHGYGDVISDSADYNHYNISNMDVSFANGMMTVKINTGFSEASDQYGVEYGDLFISTNGWHPYTSSTSNAANGYIGDDSSTTGTSWNYVFDTSAHGLYGGNFTTYTSDDFWGGKGYIYRNDQIVQRDNGGVLYGGSSVDTTHAGSYITYNILLSSLGINGEANIGLKWGMTCGNDVIEGQASVPEPGALMLLGLGLVGLGVTARKRKTP